MSSIDQIFKRQGLHFHFVDDTLSFCERYTFILNIWIFFAHLNLWIALAKHNFKWLKISMS